MIFIYIFVKKNMIQTNDTSKWIKSEKGYVKLCPNCLSSFYGRQNKIYCDSHCKSTYNNKKAGIKRIKEASIIHPVLSNYKILESFHTVFGNNKKIGIDALKEKGFDSTLSLNQIKDSEGNQWNKINDYVFRLINASFIIITKIKK